LNSDHRQTGILIESAGPFSPAFDLKDYGFITVRDQPTKFTYVAALPEEDFKRLTKVQGKVQRKGTEIEGRPSVALPGFLSKRAVGLLSRK
jgi:hypothetical protein